MLDRSRRDTRQMGLRRLLALTRANKCRKIDQRLHSHGLRNLVRDIYNPSNILTSRFLLTASVMFIFTAPTAAMVQIPEK